MFTGGTCDSGESHENDVTLYAKIEGRREHIPLDTLTYAAYKVNHHERSRWMGWIDHSLFEPSQEYCVLNSTGTLKHDLPNTCADLGAIGHLCSTALQLLLVTPAAGRPVHCWPGLGKQASKQWAKIVGYQLKTSVVTSPHKKITPVSTQACSSHSVVLRSGVLRSWWCQWLREGLQWGGHGLSRGRWLRAECTGSISSAQRAAAFQPHPPPSGRTMKTLNLPSGSLLSRAREHLDRVHPE